MTEKNSWEKVPIDTVHQDPRNARQHSPRNLEVIARSLERFGQQRPIVVGRASRVIYAGSGTHAAALSLGWDAIAVAWSDLTGEEAIAYGIADNCSNELSDWDNETLTQLIDSLEDPLLLDVIGFDEPEIADLYMAPDVGEQDSRGKRMQHNKSPTVRIVVTVQNVTKFERAMRATGLQNRSEALLEICDAYEKRQ